MNLYSILACPKCNSAVHKSHDALKCQACGMEYPIVNGIPVMLPDGRVPEYTHQKDLSVREGYDPWIPRQVIRSLLDNQVVLDVGAGNMTLDDPCIIRMDITLTPYVDIVADMHHLPFLPGSFDYIFSLAVMEHLNNPFQAAQSVYETLKDGGLIYHECNFIWPYHGFPHHYFNASVQGIESVFNEFVKLKSGVAPYQMPSLVLNSIIDTFLNVSGIDLHAHGQPLAKLLKRVQKETTTAHDIYFDEQSAQILAAGVYYSGYKQLNEDSTIVPEVIKNIWKRDPELQARIPHLNDLTREQNIMAWAQTEGREKHPEIDEYIRQMKPFIKSGDPDRSNRDAIRQLPFFEPSFGAIGFNVNDTLETKQEQAVARDFNLLQKVNYVIKTKGLKALLQRIIMFLKNHQV